jgi:hypothetical protein
VLADAGLLHSTAHGGEERATTVLVYNVVTVVLNPVVYDVTDASVESYHALSFCTVFEWSVGIRAMTEFETLIIAIYVVYVV